MISDRDDRALAELSMGEMQTLSLTSNYPSMFGYIGVMSMGLVDVTTMGLKPDPDQDTKFETLKTVVINYWVGVGKDDFLYKSVQTLRSSLDKHGLKYTYRKAREDIKLG